MKLPPVETSIKEQPMINPFEDTKPKGGFQNPFADDVQLPLQSNFSNQSNLFEFSEIDRQEVNTPAHIDEDSLDFGNLLDISRDI